MSSVELTPIEQLEAKIRTRERKDLTGTKPGKMLEQAVRDFLLSPDKDGKKRLIKVIEQTYKRALDPRSAQGAVSSAMLLDRGFGKVRPSEEETDAMKKGIIAVYMNNPELSDVPERPAELPAPKLDPEYAGTIDAEIVKEPK